MNTTSKLVVFIPNSSDASVQVTPNITQERLCRVNSSIHCLALVRTMLLPVIGFASLFV